MSYTPEVTNSQKLVNAIKELAEANRQTAAHLRSVRETSTIYDMVAGVIPCAPVVRVTETQCVACEGVPTRKCDVCGDDLCDDCRIDHNHGEDWQ